MRQTNTMERLGSASKLVSTLHGNPNQIPPVWLMRQAGRYLPEYRQIRSQAGSFLNLCYSPDLAAEVTMQPIKRYDFDAAILFSDILVVPHALGQNVSFVEAEGPCLDPVENAQDLLKLDPARTSAKYSVVCETVDKIRHRLSSDKALIGFCGAPWTVATYMVAGRGTTDQAPARNLAYRDPEIFSQLIDILTETSIDYLSQQIAAGVNVVQIFDSWAGNLPDSEFDRWVVQPTRKIVTTLNSSHPDIPVIGFPRAAGTNALYYIRETGVHCIGCDTSMALNFMKDTLAPTQVVLQGNLDPLLLVTGQQAMEDRINDILEAMRDTPFVFNLGHGIVPQTPPDNVARLVETIRSFK